jgi:branched-chain amino acid transport system ATP-binding protein
MSESDGATMNILETTGLKKSFGGLRVLTDVNLQVEEGERHAIIGPNGAGKTTLYNVITGRFKPTDGKVIFSSQNITGLGPCGISRKGIGRSFQITNTFGNMTTFQNIRLAVLSKKGIRFNLLRKVDSMHEITKESEGILEWVGLSEDRDSLARNLPYGKQRLLEISLALATDPELIMLDEPTAGMSKAETEVAVEQIKRLTEGKSVVVIEHDMDVVFSLADRISVLHFGTLIATGAPKEIKQNQEVKDAYLGSLEV